MRATGRLFLYMRGRFPCEWDQSIAKAPGKGASVCTFPLRVTSEMDENDEGARGGRLCLYVN